MGIFVPSLSFNSGIGVGMFAIVGMLHKVRTLGWRRLSELE